MARTDDLTPEQWVAMAAQSGYSPRRLSKQFCVCPRQLRRYIWRFHGCSPRRWLNDQRLLLALRLLREEHSVKATALELGYKQVSHFSSAFKLRYGLPPSAFMKQ